MSLSMQNSIITPESRNAEIVAPKSGINLDSVDLSHANMPKLSQASPVNNKIDLGSVDITQAILPKSSPNAVSDAPALATVGQQINDEISKLWREKKSDGGFVKLAKTIGKIIKELFTK